MSPMNKDSAVKEDGTSHGDQFGDPFRSRKGKETWKNTVA